MRPKVDAASRRIVRSRTTTPKAVSAFALLVPGRYNDAMKNQFTAVIRQDEGWWIGWIEEVSGVNCQAKTRAGLLRSLRATLKEALELNRREARALAGDSAEEELLLV